MFIGIDIGTSYCCLSIFRNKKVEIIPNEFGKRQTPSYISFHDDEILFGKAAGNQLPFDLKNAFFDVKTLFGKECVSNKANCDKHLAFDVSEAPVGSGENGKYTPEEMFRRIFGGLGENAERCLGKKEGKGAVKFFFVSGSIDEEKML